MSLKGKVAIVTGGSKGIGETVVLRFIEAGASVVFTARGKASLEAAELKLKKRWICSSYPGRFEQSD